MTTIQICILFSDAPGFKVPITNLILECSYRIFFYACEI